MELHWLYVRWEFVLTFYMEVLYYLYISQVDPAKLNCDEKEQGGEPKEVSVGERRWKDTDGKWWNVCDSVVTLAIKALSENSYDQGLLLSDFTIWL